MGVIIKIFTFCYCSGLNWANFTIWYPLSPYYRGERSKHISTVIAEFWPDPQLCAGQPKNSRVWGGEVLFIHGAEAQPWAGESKADPGRARGSWGREDTSLPATEGRGYVTTEAHGHGWGLWWLNSNVPVWLRYHTIIMTLILCLFLSRGNVSYMFFCLASSTAPPSFSMFHMWNIVEKLGGLGTRLTNFSNKFVMHDCIMRMSSWWTSWNNYNNIVTHFMHCNVYHHSTYQIKNISYN